MAALTTRQIGDGWRIVWSGAHELRNLDLLGASELRLDPHGPPALPVAPEPDPVRVPMKYQRASDARVAVRRYLRRHGTTTVDDLAAALAWSRPRAARAVVNLRHRGELEVVGMEKTAGRPRQRYRLRASHA